MTQQDRDRLVALRKAKKGLITQREEAQISLNGRVLLAATALAAVTAVLLGLAPALGAFTRNLSEPLKAGGRGHSGFPPWPFA
jgi:hypothetical protein